MDSHRYIAVEGVIGSGKSHFAAALADSLNGRLVNEPYAVHSQQYIDPYRDNFPANAHTVPQRPRAAEMLEKYVVNDELVVPPGYIFAMGDNRDDSFDSRYWGAVDRKKIVGRATAVVMSTDRKHHWLPRWQRFFSSLKG